MNDRLVIDPAPIRELNPEIAPQLEEIVRRALEREPRHRYATASEMQRDLEHQDQVGLEESATNPRGRAANARSGSGSAAARCSTQAWRWSRWSSSV